MKKLFLLFFFILSLSIIIHSIEKYDKYVIKGDLNDINIGKKILIWQKSWELGDEGGYSRQFKGKGYFFLDIKLKNPLWRNVDLTTFGDIDNFKPKSEFNSSNNKYYITHGTIIDKLPNAYVIRTIDDYILYFDFNKDNIADYISEYENELKLVREKKENKQIENEKKYYDFLNTLKLADQELIRAVIGGYYEKMMIAIQMGANINVTDANEMTPLMILVHSKFSSNMAKYLLEHNANVNAITSTGVTALMIASTKGYIELVELLISYDADVNVREKTYNFSAYDMAKMNNHTEIMLILQLAGAK